MFQAFIQRNHYFPYNIKVYKAMSQFLGASDLGRFDGAYIFIEIQPLNVSGHLRSAFLLEGG